MSKQYTCSSCGESFTRGPGRPPKVDLCERHREAKAEAQIAVATKMVEPPDPEQIAVVQSDTPVIHGATSAAITRPCPQCYYAYADGGYCPSCKWSLPVNRLPYGAATGRKFDGNH